MMSPILAVGIFGGTIVLIAVLEKSGIKINQSALTVAIEAAKLGTILYFFQMISKMFF